MHSVGLRVLHLDNLWEILKCDGPEELQQMIPHKNENEYCFPAEMVSFDSQLETLFSLRSSFSHNFLCGPQLTLKNTFIHNWPCSQILVEVFLVWKFPEELFYHFHQEMCFREFLCWIKKFVWFLLYTLFTDDTVQFTVSSVNMVRWTISTIIFSVDNNL